MEEKERGGGGEGGRRGERRERPYLVCNAVGSRYSHLHIVEAISDGHILNNITRMDNI